MPRKSNGDLDKLQSLMAEESADLNENSIYLGLVFGLLLNIFGFDKRLRKGAESEGFRNWEKGRSKTPSARRLQNINIGLKVCAAFCGGASQRPVQAAHHHWRGHSLMPPDQYGRNRPDP